MQIATFEEDLLGLEDFAKRLERFIQVESNYVEGSLVLGLSSKFGSGKTTFLRMWMASIQGSDEANKPLVVFLNAWESDYWGDPLFAIVSALIDAIERSKESTGRGESHYMTTLSRITEHERKRCYRSRKRFASLSKTLAARCCFLSMNSIVAGRTMPLPIWRP